MVVNACFPAVVNALATDAWEGAARVLFRSFGHGTPQQRQRRDGNQDKGSHVERIGFFRERKSLLARSCADMIHAMVLTRARERVRNLTATNRRSIQNLLNVLERSSDILDILIRSATSLKKSAGEEDIEEREEETLKKATSKYLELVKAAEAALTEYTPYLEDGNVRTHLYDYNTYQEQRAWDLMKKKLERTVMLTKKAQSVFEES